MNKNKINKKYIYILLIIFTIITILFAINVEFIEKIDNNKYNNIVNIFITENNKPLSNNTRLNIFNNTKYKLEKKIAPSSLGSYTLNINNNSNNILNYSIFFKEESSMKINMKYKIKINNKYILGNKKNYEKINNKIFDNINLNKNAIDNIYIEWIWDSSNDLDDTLIGSSKNDEYYKLYIEIISMKKDE